MGRAIDHENDIYKLKIEAKELRAEVRETKIELKELQAVVAEALESLMSTKQVHHVDLHDEGEFMPPAGKRTKTTKRKTATVD